MKIPRYDSALMVVCSFISAYVVAGWSLAHELLRLNVGDGLILAGVYLVGLVVVILILIERSW